MAWGVGATREMPRIPCPEKPEFNWRNDGFEQTDEHPVVNVSWNDAVAFCKWLSDREGKTYRLPTEGGMGICRSGRNANRVLFWRRSGGA